MLLENQVDFIQSNILAGIKDEKAKKLKKKLKTKKNDSSSSSGEEGKEQSDSDISEGEIKAAEKLLTPEERARVDI